MTTAPGRRRTIASRSGSAVLVAVLAVLAAVLTAVGPARIAAALQTRSAPSGPGFAPEPTPVRVTAPSLLLTDLRAIEPGSPIPLAGGGQSPAGTLLLEFSSIQLMDLLIAQSSAGPFDLAIRNPGSAPAVIGGPGETTDLWGVLHHLDLCLSIGTLTTLAQGLPLGVVTTVLDLIAGLVPASSRDGGPCFSLAALLPILGALLRAGVPLPPAIPANDLDIDVYALHVSAPPGSTSLRLPDGVVSVRDR